MFSFRKKILSSKFRSTFPIVDWHDEYKFLTNMTFLYIPREAYLETPLLLPQSLYGRRSFVRWRHNQIFSAWWVTIFSYPWCFAGTLRAPKLRYNLRNTELGFKTNRYARTELFRSSFFPRVARLWNINLPISIRKREWLSTFKKDLRLYCFAIDSTDLMLLLFNFSQH